MNNKLMLIAGTLTALSLTACEVEQSQQAKLPNIDVDAKSGQMPKFKVEQTQKGKMPFVDVKVADRGQLPNFEVEVADIEVGEKKVSVPVPDISLNDKELTVPTVGIEMPDERDMTEEMREKKANEKNEKQ